MSAPFQTEQLIADCQAALQDPRPQQAIQDLLARTVSDPAAVVRGLGEPERAGIQALHRSDTLTVINVIWAPHMTLLPHNHEMWGVIGIYGGREDNIFWRRLAAERNHIEAAGAKSMGDRDVFPMGHDLIHSVNNPIPRFTGALHIYGGDFFGKPRSEWDPESLVERPYDVEKNLRYFEEANARWSRS